jgi:hypothetical protein
MELFQTFLFTLLKRPFRAAGCTQDTFRRELIPSQQAATAMTLSCLSHDEYNKGQGTDTNMLFSPGDVECLRDCLE